jgi:hypothetical protein
VVGCRPTRLSPKQQCRNNGDPAKLPTDYFNVGYDLALLESPQVVLVNVRTRDLGWGRPACGEGGGRSKEASLYPTLVGSNKQVTISESVFLNAGNHVLVTVCELEHRDAVQSIQKTGINANEYLRLPRYSVLPDGNWLLDPVLLMSVASVIRFQEKAKP